MAGDTSVYVGTRAPAAEPIQPGRPAAVPAPATFGSVFAVGEFRALWLAQVLSWLGDQLARVGLSVLVYSRTGSALLTALVYALSFLPAIIGGPLLAGLADRLPRRQLMVRADLARGVLVALMVVPGIPFWALCVLLVGTVLLGAPFSAARAALLPDVLPDDRYVMASAISIITDQFAQVLGFAIGGALAATLGSSTTLALDAVTFVLSALLLRYGVRDRPAPATTTAAAAATVSIRAPLRSAWAGARLVAGDRQLRELVVLAWLCGCYVVPEGLAAPYAATLGGGAGMVGLLMAAQPAGSMLGAFVLARLVAPPKRLRLIAPLAVLSCAPLVGCITAPGIGVTLALWAISGLGTAYQLAANAAFVLAVPAASRGQAFGLVQAGILAAQGITILLAGAAAQHVAPTTVVAVAGGLGTTIALAVTANSWFGARSAHPGLAPSGPR